MAVGEPYRALEIPNGESFFIQFVYGSLRSTQINNQNDQTIRRRVVNFRKQNLIKYSSERDRVSAQSVAIDGSGYEFTIVIPFTFRNYAVLGLE